MDQNPDDLTDQKKFLVRRFESGFSYWEAYDALQDRFSKPFLEIEDGLLMLREYKRRKEAKKKKTISQRNLRRSSRRLNRSSITFNSRNNSLFQISSDSETQKKFLTDFFEDKKSFNAAYAKLQKLFSNDALSWDESQNYYIKLQEENGEESNSTPTSPMDEEVYISRGLKFYEIPDESVLENIDEYFLKEEGERRERDPDMIQISICPNIIKMHRGFKVALKFTRTPVGNCFVEGRGVKELHESNFIELALSSLLTLLRSKKIKLTSVGVLKEKNPKGENNQYTWLDFFKLFDKVKHEITNLAPKIVLGLNDIDDYRPIEFIKFDQGSCFCRIKGERGWHRFRNIEEADTSARLDTFTINWFVLYVFVSKEHTPRVVIDNPSRVIIP